jgi:hypothetical protein
MSPPLVSRFRRRLAVAALAVGAALAGTAVAADPPENPVRAVDAEALPLDRAGVWTLHFAYAPPRIAKVKVPGEKDEKVVWYMVYQVYNKTDTPREFIPEFELVTKDQDGPLGRFLDGAQPSVVDAIRKIEDPTGELKLQTSVSISKNKIPLTDPALPFPTVRSTFGVAVWVDVPEKAANTNNISIYVYGLSNGLAVKGTSADPQVVISRKALQLDFRRPTDAVRNRAFDFRVFDNNGLGSEKWQYIAGPPKKNDPPKN